MDTINTTELNDEQTYPSDAVIRSVIGAAYDPYVTLLAKFKWLELEWTWRYYKDGKAWLCKVQKNSRTIAWMSAWKGFMQVTVYFPGRFLDRVYALSIQEKTKERIRQTKNVGKSKPCIFEIRTTDTIEDLETVMKFKIECK